MKDIRQMKIYNKHQINQAELEKFLLSSSESTIQVVNFLCKLYEKHYNSYQTVLFPSQNLIAQATHISRKTVNEILQKLSSLGVIKKIYRHRRTCLYYLSCLFSELLFKYEFRNLLPALKKMFYFNVSIYFMKAISKPALRRFFDQKVTPYKNIEYINSNNSSFFSDFFKNQTSNLQSEGQLVQELMISGQLVPKISHNQLQFDELNKIFGKDKEKNSIKKENMESKLDKQSLITHPIHQTLLKRFNLSMHGLAKLHAFTFEELENALQKCTPATKFSQFIELCISSSLPDWQMYYLIIQRYKIDKHQPLIENISKKQVPMPEKQRTIDDVLHDYNTFKQAQESGVMNKFKAMFGFLPPNPFEKELETLKK